MKNKFYFFTILTFVLIQSAFSQIQPFGHLTIFSEDGDKFYLVINGEVMNDEPQTNIRIEELTNPQYNAKITFEDATLEPISKNYLQISDVDGIMMDVTYKIKRDKNKKGKMKMNYFSSIPVVQGFVAPSNVYVRRFGGPNPVRDVVIVEGQSGTVTQSTTTTRSTGGIGASVSLPGVNVNVSINDPNYSGTVTETTTTTTSGGGYYEEDLVGCQGNPPMRANDFNSALNTLKQSSYDDSSLKTAKQIATSNCLNANQIESICKIFKFEETKLDFAKFAYLYCTDTQNYFKVNTVFSFSSSTDELNEYIERL